MNDVRFPKATIAQPDPLEQLRALRRLALAVAGPSGPTLSADLLRELTHGLRAHAAFACVYADDSRTTMRTIAVYMEGQVVANFDFALDSLPCQAMDGDRFCYLPSGFRDGRSENPVVASALDLDACAALPMKDSHGTPQGLLVVLDRRPVAEGDPDHTEAMLKIVAGRLGAEIERAQSDEVLRAAALAVSDAQGGTVFDQLVRLLATILHVEAAFIARPIPGDPTRLVVLALYCDGQIVRNIEYTVSGRPCETVIGQTYRIYPDNLLQRFPDDEDARAQCAQSYAGYPLLGLDGTPLGLVSIWSRRPLALSDRIESMLKIFAVRASAEIERMNASEALGRSEASYRAIFDAAESAVFVHDWDSGAILDVNPKACETYGYSYAEMREITVADVSSGLGPYTAENAIGYLQLAKLGRCPPFEWQRRNKDGSLHWDEVRLKPVMLNGRPHILAFTREITAHKEALAAVQAREEQYRAIFDGSADCLGLWNQDLRLVDVNQAFTRIRGLARDDVMARTLSERRNEPEFKQREALMRGALGGREGRIEVQMPNAEGATMDIEIRYIPVDFGGVRHVLSVARDVTEHRARERELRRSEARLRATVEAAFDCVIGMDGEGRIVEFNAAAERCFGHQRQEVLGRMLSDVIIPDRHRDSHTRGLKHFHSSGRGPMVGRLVETTARRIDGTEIPVELAISVAAVPEGSIFVGHLRDISARRAAEAERAALEAQLRQAQKMEAIGQLTGGIAHDFNNILTSVIGYLVLGQERAERLADGTLQRQLGQAHLAAQRARDLIAQMLTFARRQRGERRALPLTPLVRQTLQLLRPTLASSIALESALPDEHVHGQVPWVLADTVQLEQVLFNLCINARDAMAGAGRMRVGLGVHGGGRWQCASCRAHVESGQWVELSVSDSGHGIGADVLDRVFDPFFSTKPPGQGSGMGLAMVHGIVHDHGGHIQVQTAPDAGSVFTVMLPLISPASEQTEKTSASATTASHLRGRVLLVEDDTMVGDYLHELLTGWGLDVVLQRDPLEALSWLGSGEHAVDLLLTDQTMPSMTGLQMAETVQARRPGLPVVMVSGNAASFDPDDLKRAGVRAALPKPLDTVALREQLVHLLAA